MSNSSTTTLRLLIENCVQAEHDSVRRRLHSYTLESLDNHGGSGARCIIKPVSNRDMELFMQGDGISLTAVVAACMRSTEIDNMLSLRISYSLGS